jgi:hypothetical protein
VENQEQYFQKKHCATVAIVTPSGLSQWTIGKPVGITDCDPEGWCIHRTADINSMIERKDDPQHSIVQAKRHNWVSAKLVASGHLVKHVDEKTGKAFYCYAGDTSKSRSLIKADARTIARERTKDLKAKYNKLDMKTKVKVKKGKKKPKLTPAEAELKTTLAAEIHEKGSFQQYMSQSHRTYESLIVQYEKDHDLQEESEEKFPTLYRTLTGPYADTAQEIIPGSSRKTLAQVTIELKRHMRLFKMESGGVEDVYDTPVAIPPKPPSGEVGTVAVPLKPSSGNTGTGASLVHRFKIGN